MIRCIKSSLARSGPFLFQCNNPPALLDPFLVAGCSYKSRELTYEAESFDEDYNGAREEQEGRGEAVQRKRGRRFFLKKESRLHQSLPDVLDQTGLSRPVQSLLKRLYVEAKEASKTKLIFSPGEPSLNFFRTERFMAQKCPNKIRAFRPLSPSLARVCPKVPRPTAMIQQLIQ